MRDFNEALPHPLMANEDHRLYLLNAKRWSIQDQLTHRESIVAAFKTFWDGRPSEEQFDRVVGGIVLHSGMLYYMVTSRQPVGLIGLG